ncbi:hypothetical protein D9V41_15580 [Aeromicrobium phragmitis]|uniref:Uncharacterized protein n=1 Tax=Aeromicrobium phragmitis TaxID=2478914 RepID=A0A3L8PJ14_9ACTN|nr:hypothetical protein D9V41_15580 [Aeromicrobium phragmitis]
MLGNRRIYDYSSVLDAVRVAILQGCHASAMTDDDELEAHFQSAEWRPVFIPQPGIDEPLEAVIGTSGIEDPVLNVRSVPTLLRSAERLAVPYSYLAHPACAFCQGVWERRRGEADDDAFVLVAFGLHAWQLMHPSDLRRCGVALETLPFRLRCSGPSW